MIFKTVFRPDWQATEELRQCVTQHDGLFRGFMLEYSLSSKCDVIIFNGRTATLPESLRDVPMLGIGLYVQGHKSTLASDGTYIDGDFWARVWSYGETALQEFRIKAAGSTTIEALNQWFDELIAGKKSIKLVSAA